MSKQNVAKLRQILGNRIVVVNRISVKQLKALNAAGYVVCIK